MIYVMAIVGTIYIVQAVRFRRRVPLAMTVFLFAMAGVACLCAVFYLTGVLHG